MIISNIGQKGKKNNTFHKKLTDHLTKGGGLNIIYKKNDLRGGVKFSTGGNAEYMLTSPLTRFFVPILGEIPKPTV